MQERDRIPDVPRPRRSGVAMVLVLSILLVLAAFGTVLFRFSRGAIREVDTLSGHLRALAAADAAYSEVVARLATTGWEGRWFRNGPEVRSGVAAVGGSYDALVRDEPGRTVPPAVPVPVADLDPGHAELLVKGRWSTHTAMCVWRLTVPRDGFDELARIVPTYFGHLPEGTPMTPATLDAVGTKIAELVGRRERNRPDFDARRPAVEAATSPRGISEALGLPLPPFVLEEIPSASGGLPLPLGHYTDAVKTGMPRLPAIPGQGGWTEVPWRGWRTGGPKGAGGRSGIADRSRRGSDAESKPWSEWPGWQLPGGGTPWVFAPNWDAWTNWGNRQAAGGGGGGFDWSPLLGAIGRLLGAGGAGSPGGSPGGPGYSRPRRGGGGSPGSGGGSPRRGGPRGGR